MTDLVSLLHYGSIGLMACVSTIGVGMGQGSISRAAIDAINIQPAAQSNIVRIAVFGMVLLEFAAIAGVTFALFLLFGGPACVTLPVAVGEVGIALAISITGLLIGIASYYPAKEACLAVARQPFFGQPILRFMLLSQSIIQTPVIFGFIIGMFIRAQLICIPTLYDGIRLLFAGLCIGLGSLGPAIGLALFAQQACRGVGRNPGAYASLMSFTFISQAIIETPLLFSLLISLLCVSTQVCYDLTALYALISACLCVSIGTFGPGISSGRTAAAACKQIVERPEQYSILSKTSMFGQGIIDSSAIYAFLIALMIFFFR